MIEMNAVVAGTELDAARDAGREGMSAGWCAWSAGDASLMFSLVVRPDVNMHAFHGLPFVVRWVSSGRAISCAVRLRLRRRSRVLP